jgi:mono/diheme cytochrome c family protein
MSLKPPSLAGVLIGLTAMVAFGTAARPSNESSGPVTFNKDVLQVLQKNCQDCHRPGEIGPMPLLTYQQARPWAKAIKVTVEARKMPPWFADQAVGHFSNDARLSDTDINTLSAWADTGAAEGNPADAAPARQFVDGWNIQPDMVIEMPKDFEVPATGTINYQNFLVKANFPEDKWVVAAEMRPGNRAVVHHERGDVREPGSTWMKDAVAGEPYENGTEMVGRNGEGENLLGKFNPGVRNQRFDFEGSAKFIPKGSDFVFNVHYTAKGTAATDRSKLGLVFARRPPNHRFITVNEPSARNLVILPGDPNAEVVSEATVQADCQLVEIQPHMHLRGKDQEVRLIYPSGKMETIFRAKFDFNWHLDYDFATPIDLPKGTRVVLIGHFDNSPGNRANPDPTTEVHWGDQNWDEMSGMFLGIMTPDLHATAQTLFKLSGPTLLSRTPGKAGPTLADLVLPAPGTK